MNERILEARETHQRHLVELAHWQHPRLSAWELGALLYLDERTVAHHLEQITGQDVAA